jgi:hypothetical protein
MTDNNKYSTLDLISAALEQKPIDFENAFNDILVNKLNDAIAIKKVEIAQGIYKEPEAEEELEEK